MPETSVVPIGVEEVPLLATISAPALTDTFGLTQGTTPRKATLADNFKVVPTAPFQQTWPSDLTSANRVPGNSPFWMTERVTSHHLYGTIASQPTQAAAPGNAYFAPLIVDVEVTATNTASPFNAISWGIESDCSFGGKTGAVAAIGTAHNFTARMNVRNSGSASNEFACFFGEITVETGAARSWFGDFSVQGGATRQTLLNGITMVVNNGNVSAPTAGPAGCFWAAGGYTKNGVSFGAGRELVGATPSMTDVGYGVVGGFKVGMQIGGWGSGWMDSTMSSTITTGITMDGLQSAAIAIGSTPTSRGGQIVWNGDTNLYRAGQYITAVDNSFEITGGATLIMYDTGTGARRPITLVNGALTVGASIGGAGLGGVQGTSTVIASDDFNRAAAGPSTTALGSTPVGNKTYTIYDGTASVNSTQQAQLTKASNTVRPRALIDAAVSNVQVGVTLTRTDAYARVYARQDATGRGLFATHDGSQTWLIYFSDGTTNTEVTRSASTFTFASGSSRDILFRVSGNTVSLLVNGTTVISTFTYSGTLPTFGTLVGFGDDTNATGGNKWDNLGVTAL